MAIVTEEAPSGFLKSKTLLKFQVDGILTAYPRPGHLLCWDAGTGKSVGAIAMSALCFQDGAADLTLVVCERNKRKEWVADFEADTDLTVRLHHGPGREKRLERLGMPQVLVTTYETAKTDCAVLKGPRSYLPGYLLEAMRNKRVLVIYDECAKLRNRSSANYKTHEFLLKTLRKWHPQTKVLGLSATPLEKGYEDGYNQLRLLVPQAMPIVKDFERTCILYRDPFGRPKYNMIGINEFMKAVEPNITRKRKTDPDVIEQFPPLTEEFRYVEMASPQKQFYEMAESLAFEMGGEDAGAWTTLRQIANHPASIIHSASRENGSKFAKEIVDVLGVKHLLGLPSAKADELKSYLTTITDQDSKAVVFTFFGQSVLLDLERILTDAGLMVFTYHGGKTAAENELSKEIFKSHNGGAVLLSSDGGARGINLPEATYVVEYESALTHAMRIQRINRAHRINSRLGPVTAMTLITESTIEENIFQNVLLRNETHDVFAGDLDAGEEFTSADDRRTILALARARYESRKR